MTDFVGIGQSTKELLRYANGVGLVNSPAFWFPQRLRSRLPGMEPRHSMRNPYESLDLKAEAAPTENSVRALFEEIHSRTLFGTLPSSLMTRLIRAQLSYVQDGKPTVTEATVANAVNFLGPLLDNTVYSGTNARQIRLVRESFFIEIRHLLQAPNRSITDVLGDDRLSPAGGVFVAFIVLRNKLTNPAWFLDPDEQIKLAFSSDPTVRANLARLARADNSTRLWSKLTAGLADQTSRVVRAFDRFLDMLGLVK
jgi:hypothetical protein